MRLQLGVGAGTHGRNAGSESRSFASRFHRIDSWLLPIAYGNALGRFVSDVSFFSAVADAVAGRGSLENGRHEVSFQLICANKSVGGDAKAERQTSPVLLALENELDRLPEVVAAGHARQFCERLGAQLEEPLLL